ncbi:hypothetical protein BURPS1710b_A0298 [Burkholderia pseudomallei 1710b]|uniref:Uncharacterized protein n=1 Tax=Burkholderia pseudomallei (strain 1710b) TaxID=320372 RepID=Q3JLU5_BURP1|nr:hypothetical protein BURPS1710b_A0298 [Burkholderia pseudomallei 1710b]
MKAHRADRVLQRHLEVVQVRDHLEDRREDPRAARRADHERDLAVLREDRRRHRRQRPLLRLDRVRVAADDAEHVGDARLRGEIVHLVVEHDARAFGDDARAEVAVDRVRVRHRVAPLVDDGEMRRLGLLRHRRAEARQHALRVGRLLGIHLGRALGDVRGVGQLRDGHLVEIRIAEVLRAIGEHALLDLGDQMHVLRRIERDAVEIGLAVRLHRQQLHEADAARARRRRGDHAIAVPVRLDRLAPHRLVLDEILLRDQAAALLHRCGDQVGRLAVVEILRAVVRDAREHRSELRLLEGRARLQAAEVLIEVRLAAELLRRVDATLRELLVDNEAVARVTDRGRDHLLPLQLAEALLRLPHPGHRAGHADRAIAVQAHALDDVAVLVEIHVLRRGERRALAIVEKVRLAAHVDGHEAAAADVARLRIGDGEREGDRDRGVDRVAALPEDLLGRVGAVLVGDRDGRAVQHDALLRALRMGGRARQKTGERRAHERGEHRRLETIRCIHWMSPISISLLIGARKSDE